MNPHETQSGVDIVSAQPGAVHWHSKPQIGVPAQRLWRRARDSFMLRMLGRVGNESIATRFRSCISIRNWVMRLLKPYGRSTIVSRLRMMLLFEIYDTPVTSWTKSMRI